MLTGNYTKMAGCGNDFIIVDVRTCSPPDSTKAELARSLCRRDSVGADGLIFIEGSRVADLKMDYFNSDGSRGEMCGNGLRCLARYAADRGYCSREMAIETGAGVYRACCVGSTVTVHMPEMAFPQLDLNLGALRAHYMVVGVPHAVIFAPGCRDWTREEVVARAQPIRHHPFFAQGTNVNFVSPGPADTLYLRTFERGVEGETLACGTGAVASALVASLVLPGLCSPVVVLVPGGELQVGFVRAGDRFRSVWLRGEAVYVDQEGGCLCSEKPRP